MIIRKEYVNSMLDPFGVIINVLFGWGIDKISYKQRVYKLLSKDSSTSSQMVYDCAKLKKEMTVA